MSKMKQAAVGCALVLSAFSVQAAQVEDGMKACADALVKQLSESQAISSEYAIDPARGFNGKRDRLAPREAFQMNARSADSDEVIARVDCVVNHRAEVLELKGLPLAQQDASRTSGVIH